MDIPPPKQITYEEVCQQTGKLYLESRYEIDRLSSMLIELQKNFLDEQSKNVQLSEQLKQAQQRMAQLESDLTLVKVTAKVKNE